MANSQSSSLIRSMPAEMIDAVLDNLSEKELYNLRLTCKLLYDHATPVVFSSLKVWLEERSLQNLVNIARQPHLAKHIKAVLIGMDRFYDVDEEMFHELVYDRRDFHDDDSIEHKSEAWAVYRRGYESQCELDTSDRDVSMMTEAFMAFSLSTVGLLDSWPLRTNEVLVRGPCNIEREGMLLDGMLSAARRLMYVPRGGRQLSVLLRALAGSNQNLGKLEIHMSGDNIGISSPLSSQDRSLAMQAFASVKSLWLDLGPIRFQDMHLWKTWKATAGECSLTTILTAMTNLKSLFLLQFPAGNDGPSSHGIFSNPAITWHDCIQITKFGQLTELAINGGVLRETDFTAFLLQSCQKVKSLNLSCLFLIEDGEWSPYFSDRGSWDAIFQTIRSLPELERVELENLEAQVDDVMFSAFSSQLSMDPQPLYDFLLRKRKDNPWMSMCSDAIAQIRQQWAKKGGVIEEGEEGEEVVEG